MRIDDLVEAKVWKRGEDICFGGVLAEDFDGADAVGVENVVDVSGEVVADSGGRDGDAGGPLLDDLLDVSEAVVAGGSEIVGELRGCEIGVAERFGTDGPDGGDPGEIGACTPFSGEVDP